MRVTKAPIANVTVQQLRNHSVEVLDRVAAGQRMIVTRWGRPVAELWPHRGAPVMAEVLLRRWRRLPAIDAAQLHGDLDDILTLNT